MSGFETATLKIINFPDPRLKQICSPVEAFDDSLRALAVRMIELMREFNGIGLAAPQVGILKRLFVCNVTGEPGEDSIFVNPQLADFQGDVEGEEGCLSIPDVTVQRRRASSCTLQGRDLEGNAVELIGIDLLARVWQHEVDHLDGKLITDRMTEADKLANRRALKLLEAEFKRSGTRR